MYGREPPRNRELDISHREANNAFNRGNVPSGGPPRAGGQGSAGVENEIYRAERFYFRWVGKKGFRLSRGVTKRNPLGPKKIRTQHVAVQNKPNTVNLPHTTSINTCSCIKLSEVQERMTCHLQANAWDILFGRSPTNHRYLPAMHGILLFDR